MISRDAVIRDFLGSKPWIDMKRTHLAGDASDRKYERLIDTKSGKSFVLMDSPGDPVATIIPFIELTEYLEKVELSPPKILKRDIANGLLIIEDLGDTIFARVMRDAPKDIALLYRAATDVLLHLHKQKPPEILGAYGPKEMAEVGCLAFSWYAKGCDSCPSQTEIDNFQRILESILAKVWFGPNVLVQRDYHAENLLWLPDRHSPKNVGLLDYQDGRIGHVAYDLVSLLEDARRDVEPEVAADTLTYYVKQSGFDSDEFRAAYAAMGAQRNLRILGVFARLSMHFGKPSYVDLIPRVWAYLQKDLSHPVLVDLKEICETLLPYPSQENLEKLKAKCGTIPHL